MTTYILRRLLQVPVAVLGVTLIIFVLVHLGGNGNVVDLYLPLEADAEMRSVLYSKYGLDQPLPVQYGRFVLNLMRGDFGHSIYYQKPALEMVLSRIPATVQLMTGAVLLAALLGILLGTISAMTRGSLLDLSLSTYAVFGQSVPSFWLGIMLILFFAVRLDWLPTSGKGTWQHFILPVFTLMNMLLPYTLLLVRSAVLQLLHEDFVLVARAKGLTERAIYARHILKNSLNPAVSSLGVQMAHVMGGAAITESVFAWPGLGRLGIEAVSSADLAIVQASVVLLAVWTILSTLTADIVVAILDPRIRISE